MAASDPNLPVGADGSIAQAGSEFDCWSAILLRELDPATRMTQVALA